MKIFVHFILFLTLFGSLVSCVSSTVIRAVDANNNVDSDVHIYVDRKYVGKGEVIYSDKKTVYSAVPFYELRKEGCKMLREKLDVKTNLITLIAGSIFTGVGLGVTYASFYSGDPHVAYVAGLPIFLLGSLYFLWTREYTPLQEQTFQCVRTTDK